MLASLINSAKCYLKIKIRKIKSIENVVLDKTGTITFGNLRVVNFWAADDEREILNVVYNLISHIFH